jgi:hypothetical protein
MSWVKIHGPALAIGIIIGTVAQKYHFYEKVNLSQKYYNAGNTDLAQRIECVEEIFADQKRREIDREKTRLATNIELFRFQPYSGQYGSKANKIPEKS